MTPDRQRLERLLGGAANERLRRRLRERVLAGSTRPITLIRASEAERASIERLLGRPPRRGRSLRVDPAALAATLERAGIAPDLRQALEALDGPLHDPAAARAVRDAQWDRVVEALRPTAERLGYADWLEAITGQGLIKRLAGGDPERGRSLLADALAVLAALPGGGITRSTLAARDLGDAHALDRGQPVAALVRRALRDRAASTVADPADERSLWASAGVLIGGDISSTVLSYQLPATAAGANSAALAAANAAGEPVYLTLRQLLRQATDWQVAGHRVFVCENPGIVAEAAEQLGTACAPLVATAGRPGAAVFALLQQLVACGARLEVRADLDWAGIAIVNSLLARLPGEPWRMDSPTVAAHSHVPGRPLEGKPLPASWEPGVSEALQARGMALEEEQLLAALLADLADPDA